MNINKLSKKLNIPYQNLYYHIKRYGIKTEKELINHINFEKEKKKMVYFRIDEKMKSDIDNFSSNSFSDNIREIILIGLEKSKQNKKEARK
ncbi:MAG: hypothetical protein M0R03_23655 [Novosphingobium sp.]|jgi:membrane protease subunit (stomatin/prohibitin family)|nr:hypothetical protein [Novosphingobium sp.]